MRPAVIGLTVAGVALLGSALWISRFIPVSTKVEVDSTETHHIDSTKTLNLWGEVLYMKMHGTYESAGPSQYIERVEEGPMKGTERAGHWIIRTHNIYEHVKRNEPWRETDEWFINGQPVDRATWERGR